MIHLEKERRLYLKRLQKKAADRREYVKITTILMLDSGFKSEDIAESLGIDAGTVFRYQAEYLAMKLEEYLRTAYEGRQSRLSDEEEQALEAELEVYLYATAQEVRAYVQDAFGVDYTLQGIVALLHRLGFEYKKTRLVSEKCDEAAQRAFVQKLEQTMSGLGESDALYFNDAVHPTHNTRADYGWIKKGETYPMPSNTGRSRLNLNGALNAEEVTDVVVDESERIDQASVIRLWEAIEAKRPNAKIIQVCDNARYYHGRLVKEWLEKHPRTRVMFLPSYAPNLNLIERLWKYLRKEVISHYFYKSKEDFREAVMDFFRNIHHHKHKLQTLLTLKFQIVSPAR
jgi:transposase